MNTSDRSCMPCDVDVGRNISREMGDVSVFSILNLDSDSDRDGALDASTASGPPRGRRSPSVFNFNITESSSSATLSRGLSPFVKQYATANSTTKINDKSETPGELDFGLLTSSLSPVHNVVVLVVTFITCVPHVWCPLVAVGDDTDLPEPSSPPTAAHYRYLFERRLQLGV